MMKDDNQCMNEMYAAYLFSANHGSVTCKQQQPMPKAMQSIWIIGSFEVSNSGVLEGSGQMKGADVGCWCLSNIMRQAAPLLHILKTMILQCTSMTNATTLMLGTGYAKLLRFVKVCIISSIFLRACCHWPGIPEMK